MWYEPYGQTGKSISAVSFGGMRFPGDQSMEANAEIVTYAYSKGINYFDTAPGYKRSEDTFGIAFEQMDRDKFYVSTKSSKSDGDALRADLEQSLQRMKIDKIDFFHIWYVMSLDIWRARIDGGAVSAALQAKEEGLIDHLAVSSHMPGEDLETMLKEGPFEGVTLGYCAINFPYRDVAIDAAGQLGIGVVTMNPLGGGLIPRYADHFDFLRDKDDPSVVAAAIRFNVSNPSITSALVGFSCNEHVDEAVEAVTDFKPYDRSHIMSMRERIIGEMNELCTGCGYCLPCPEGVEIPKLMEAYNIKSLGGSDEQIADRLSDHWELSPAAAEACALCGDCEARCTQHLPIQQRLAEIAKIKPKK